MSGVPARSHPLAPAKRGWANPDGTLPPRRSVAALRRLRAAELQATIAVRRDFQPMAWAALGEFALRRFRAGMDTHDIAGTLGQPEPVVAAALTDRWAFERERADG